MPTIAVNGTDLAYTERGAGPPVVFIHGGLADLRSWEAQLPAFAGDYRAVALSCRHFHPNEPVPEDDALSLDTLADDLAAFLRALDLAPAHLVGSSSGAFIALLVARREPDLVRSLVLAEPPVLPLLGVSTPPGPLELLRLLLRSPRTAMTVVKFGATGIAPATRAFSRGDHEEGARAFNRAVLGREAAAAISPAVERQALDNAATFCAQLRAGLPPFGPDDARSVDTPALLVTGEHSAPVHHLVVDQLERLMPRAERFDMEGASHYMYEDRPEAFNRAALEFLERQAA